jgi:adenine phosphoribosyltransferase
MALDLKDHIRGVPDFPKEGILFYDIGTLLAHGPAWRQTIDQMAALIEESKPDGLLAIESRGFLVGAPLAARLGIGLVMARKKGKLPGVVARHDYALEYGTDTIEIQTNVIERGMRLLVIDDLLATGGTANAALSLARQMGAEIAGAAFVIELTFLNGRKKLDVPVHSLLRYES